MPVGQGSNRAAWPSNDDFTFLSLAVVAIGMAFFGWLAWTNYHAEISGIAAEILHWQIGLISHFTPALDGMDRTIAAANMDAVTNPEILTAFNLTGEYFRIPAIAFILILAVLCFTRAAPSQFTRTFDLDGLIREQMPYCRPIAAYARRDLRLVPLQPNEVRSSDPALHAREWVTRYAAKSDAKGSSLQRFDDRAASRAFILQLGPPWRGVEQAPGHVRVLYAAFGLHLEQRRAEAQSLLGAFAESLPPGGRSEAAGPSRPYALSASILRQADEELRSAEVFQQAAAIAAGHAYTAPALMSLLTMARRRAGVLAPAQFAGLKLVDRSLWYALHSLGFEGDGPGQTTHPNPRVEAAGARDHWAAERLAGRPLVTPSVERAVSAVRAKLMQDEVVTQSPEVS